MALGPKKSVIIQARRRPSVDITPVLGKSGANVTASLVDQAPPMVAPVPSVGQAGMGARRMPSEVAKELVTEEVPLPTTGRSKLPTALVVPTPAGVT